MSDHHKFSQCIYGQMPCHWMDQSWHRVLCSKLLLLHPSRIWLKNSSHMGIEPRSFRMWVVYSAPRPEVHTTMIHKNQSNDFGIKGSVDWLCGLTKGKSKTINWQKLGLNKSTHLTTAKVDIFFNNNYKKVWPKWSHLSSAKKRIWDLFLCFFVVANRHKLKECNL